jgi:hypothetical protein
MSEFLIRFSPRKRSPTLIGDRGSFQAPAKAAATDRRARLPEWRAALEWILESWRRPAGAEAGWQQNTAHREAGADVGGA